MLALDKRNSICTLFEIAKTYKIDFVLRTCCHSLSFKEVYKPVERFRFNLNGIEGSAD